jgi:hypothetical protein
MPARMNAVAHAVHLLATARASLANRGAELTTLIMEMRAAKHEVGRGLADFNAVRHQSKMRRLHMLAAGFQAFRNGGMQADVMAFLTRIYAFAHLRIHWMVHADLFDETKKYQRSNATSIPGASPAAPASWLRRTARQ